MKDVRAVLIRGQTGSGQISVVIFVTEKTAKGLRRRARQRRERSVFRILCSVAGDTCSYMTTSSPV
jgi:hypothetical protein